jgi:energy-coupling factor transporter ATP-binding protein EcfA2
MKTKTQAASTAKLAVEFLPDLKAAYINALGPSLSTADLTARLSHVPKVTDADRRLDGTDRIVRGEQIQDEVVIAHPASMDLYHSTRSALVRRYEAVTNSDARLLRQIHGVENHVAPSQSRTSLLRPSASIVLIGPTGMGKTTLMNAISQLTHQCVRHTNLIPGTEVVQILFVYIALTGDATVKNLMLRIVEAIDRALGSTLYSDRIRNSRMTAEQLRIFVQQLCIRYGIGMIMVDEMQNLTSSRAGGADLVTNELMHLRDAMGIPLMFAGTFAMMPMLANDARMMRRVSQNGFYPMTYASNAVDPYWQLLCKVRWQCMVVRKPQPMSDDILRALFDCTQGMTWALTSLICKAQRRAIRTGNEAVTAELLRKTFALDATEMHGLVHAVASGDETVLASYEDLYHPFFDQRKIEKRSAEFERLQAITREREADAMPVAVTASVPKRVSKSGTRKAA